MCYIPDLSQDFAWGWKSEDDYNTVLTFEKLSDLGDICENKIPKIWDDKLVRVIPAQRWGGTDIKKTFSMLDVSVFFTCFFYDKHALIL